MSPGGRVAICRLCDGEIQPSPERKYRPPSTCLAAGCVHPPACWQSDPDPLVAFCAQSQRKARSRQPGNLDLAATLRTLGMAIRLGDADVLRILEELTPEQRHSLLMAVVPPLSVHLARLLASRPDLSVKQRVRRLAIPSELPAGLRAPLEAYEEKLIRKYEARLKAGHSPSADYVRRGMVTPIRYANYLSENGIHQWDAAQKKDLVGFLKKNPKVIPAHISIFIRFLQEARPWRDRRGSRSTQGRKPTAVVPPNVLPPEQLEQLISSLDGVVSEAQFLLVWLIGRMGLPLKKAYNMPLHQVRVNDNGRLVIRPADVWVILPREISGRLDALIEDAIPGWKTLQPYESSHLTFFNRHLPHVDRALRGVLAVNVRELRASALHSAMMRGYVDRVTLHHTTGASLRYLTILEGLMSVDMHRRLAADFVKKRNAHILGEVDE